jgi:hypothetical protein
MPPVDCQLSEAESKWLDFILLPEEINGTHELKVTAFFVQPAHHPPNFTALTF